MADDVRDTDWARQFHGVSKDPAIIRMCPVDRVAQTSLAATLVQKLKHDAGALSARSRKRQY